MYRKQQILSAPDRTRHQALRGVPCHQSPRSMASHPFIPTVHIASCHRTLTASSNQPGCGETAINRNMFGVTDRLYLSRKMIFPVILLPKTLQPRVPSGAQTKTSAQSNARHVPINGQARRRPVESPRSNTRVCLDFVSKTFIFQKLLL